MRDLYVMPQTPVVGGGGLLRSYGVVRALAAHRPVDVAYQVAVAPEPSREWRDLENVTLHPIVPSKGVRRLATYASRRARGVPKNVARAISYELSHAAAALADTADRGRVIASTLGGGGALLPLARRRPVIYDSHDLNSSFRHRVDGRGLGSPRSFALFERRLLETMAEVWMVSPRDVEGARSLAPGANVRYVPNVVDVRRIAPVSSLPRTHTILFVAQFGYPPNRVGLRFLLGEVMPHVWRALPAARLSLVGAGLESERPTDSRVDIRGRVEDLDAEYGHADCAVVPLLEGGGTPLKFLEAMAYAVPVVATPHAAGGLDIEPGSHYLEGHDGPSFAAAIVDALESDQGNMRTAARRIVEDEYSVETLTRILSPGG